MYIYVTAPVGTEGAVHLYQMHKAAMQEHFPRFFIRQIEALQADRQQLTLAKNKDCIYICTMTEGGIFRALWEGCEKLDCGCEVFLEKIPIRQEVIEICELTGDNPYELDSSGSLLLFSETDEQDRAFHLIGKTTGSRDRVVVFQGGRRFLTPPKRQQTDINSRKSGIQPYGQ